MFDNLFHAAEKYIIRTVCVFALLYLVFEVVHLAVIFFYAVAGYDFFPDADKPYKPFMQVVIVFFNILIGLEMLETLRVDLRNYAEKTKLILLICLIAVSRKLISIDLKYTDALQLFALAGLTLSLTVGYFFLAKGGIHHKTITNETMKKI